jgi:hypothetical protein
MDAEGNMRLIHEGGMTLRDYFAGQVLNGLFSGNNTGSPIADIVQRAYIYADAMLEARGE